MKIFHVNNPACSNGKGNLLFPSIVKELNKQQIDHTSIQTKYAGEASEIIAGLDFSEYNGLAISGGDGSLFEVVNGYFKNKSQNKIPILPIPIGRGNAFARDLDFHPEKWQESISALKNLRTRKVDVGFCKAADQEFYFVNILGLGFVTDVAQTAFKLRMFGHLSYILGVFHRVIGLKSFPLKLEADGKIIERENVFTEVSNTRFTGKDFLMAPTAIIDDGMLNITLLNKLTRIKVLQALPKIFTGEHIKMKEVETITAKKIKIDTKPNKILTPDGQLMSSTPIEIECLEKVLEVFIK